MAQKAATDEGKRTPGKGERITHMDPPRLAMKWSPMHLWYFYPSWQFSLEHKLLKNLNIQYEAGWITDLQDQGLEYQDERGYRAAVELRHYMPSPSMVPFYVAAEFYYHNVRFDRTSVVGYNCVGGPCDYYQYASYPVKNGEWGPSLKFGMLFFPGWHHNRSFFFDVNSGFAYRRIDYRYDFDPMGRQIEFLRSRDPALFRPNESLTERVRFLIGMRFCYRFI